jgi:ankyrin repeat protein
VIKSSISQFQLQEFDFSSYLAYKREGFVGRKWFFLELENILEENQVTAGVLITGEPGSGKSALMSQLICSPHSSLLIHDNTIGYHLCEYSEKGKRDGARFVRNLVDQIAARIPEYSKHVMNNEQIRAELDTRCHKDPTSCFFTTIVGPLRKLKQPDGLRFIVIDALDECFESDMKTSEIMEILQSKILHFPKWLKVIMTSRNLTSVTSRLPQMLMTRTALYAMDERNVNDIRYYVSRFISQNTEFLDRLLMAVNIGSRTDGIKIFLNEVITRAEGNFLFAKMTLQYLNDTGRKVEFHSLPTSLFALYSSFLNRQFGKDGFGPFRSLFEVLLAVYSPLQFQDVQEILKSEYEAGDIPKLIDHVSCFLRFGRDGTVRLFHQSFADWLTNKTPMLLINKTRGHQSIAKFLLHRIRERHVNVTFEELTELFMHILSGQASEMQEAAMNLFNIAEMREPHTNQSILHYLVTQPTIYLPVLDFFLHKFRTVDVLDSSNKTPAYYAASEGFVRSLQSCINHGADISSFMKGHTEIDSVSVFVRNAGIEEFSLMHAAAAKGHTDVVELLITSNVSFPNASKNYPTPLHLAAGNGHLEVVELFYDHGRTFDLTTLHHAAARNHLAVVNFLLQTVGLRDTCIPCQMNTKTTVQEAHIIFCETALHAAVSRGLDDIVEVLLAYGKESLECKHHSGKTVLMDAVERNDTKMVDLLLRHGANVTTECGIRWKYWDMCSMYSMLKQDFLYTVYCGNEGCEDGYKAIHISAKYGLREVAERLLNGPIYKITELKNEDSNSVLGVAIMYDQKDFVQNLDTSIKKIGIYINRSYAVQSAVTYCSVNVAKLFLIDRFDMITINPFDDKDKNVWDLLLQSTKWSPCDNVQTMFKKFSVSHCLKAFQENNLSEVEKTKIESERRLNIIQLLIRTYRKYLFAKIEDGMTLLHYAASYGFEDAVKYLVDLGADELIKNQHGDTPLMIALKNSPVNDLHPSASYRCYTTNDGQFRSCNTTCYDETVRYLILLQRSSFSECDNESKYMLEQVIVKRMPLSLYALLKIGFYLNCLFSESSSVMLLHLDTGGREVSEVLNMFEVDISLQCEVSFSKSDLHRISFLFQPSLNTKLLALQRLIDRHPRGVRILNECYDAEGYLPIHRAAQGGNLAAIKWFKSIGVNTQLKTRSGLTALDISILYLGDTSFGELTAVTVPLRYRYWYGLNLQVLVTTSKYRSQVFEELLQTFFSTTPEYRSHFPCGPILEGLSPLHMAAVKGITVLKYVHKKASEIFPSLPINCLNKHRLDPVYVAQFYDSVRNEGVIDKFSGKIADIHLRDKVMFKEAGVWYGSRDEIRNTQKTDQNNIYKEFAYDGVPADQYPDREIDYIMVSNYLYHPPRETTEEKLLYESKDVRISNCPGYYDNLPKFEEAVSLENSEAHDIKSECAKIRVRRDYYWPLRMREICMREMKEHHVHTNNCPNIQKELQWWFTGRRRRNRQLNQFILKRLGWDDAFQINNIHIRWPFYFLHKTLLKEYEAYEFLKILNEALEIADIRFYSRNTYVDP